MWKRLLEARVRMGLGRLEGWMSGSSGGWEAGKERDVERIEELGCQTISLSALGCFYD